MALLCITFVKIVRKEIIATGGRGCRMTIRGYVENKFDCQISSVYTSNTASFSLTTVIYGILLQLAYWPPSCAQGRSRSGTHTALRFWGALGDGFAVMQLYWHKTGEVVPAQSKVCLEAACFGKCLQAVQMSSQRWVLRPGSQLYWEWAFYSCTSLKYSLIVDLKSLRRDHISSLGFPLYISH